MAATYLAWGLAHMSNKVGILKIKFMKKLKNQAFMELKYLKNLLYSISGC